MAFLASAGSTHTRNWVRGLRLLGIEISVISQRGLHPIEEGDYTNLSLMKFSGQAGYFLNAARARSLLDKLKPDIVHAHYASGFGTTAMLSGRKYILSVWGSDVFEFPERSIMHRKLIERNLRAASTVCVTSRALRNRVRGLCSDLPDVELTPFGVDVDQFSPGNVPRSPQTLTVGTVKSLNPVYGIDILLESFALARNRLQGMPMRLRIVGDGPERRALETQASTLGIADSVDFVGRVPHDRVVEELRKLDIYCALSRSESFGVAVLEASSCEVPVIVTSVGGLPEVVRADATGLIIPSENPSAGAEAICNLARSAKRRQQLGQAGRTFVKDNYSEPLCFQRMADVYDRFIYKYGRSL